MIHQSIRLKQTCVQKLCYYLFDIVTISFFQNILYTIVKLNFPIFVNYTQQQDQNQQQQYKFLPKDITITARTLTFISEAVAFASQQWSSHGAGFAV